MYTRDPQWDEYEMWQQGLVHPGVPPLSADCFSCPPGRAVDQRCRCVRPPGPMADLEEQELALIAAGPEFARAGLEVPGASWLAQEWQHLTQAPSQAASSILESSPAGRGLTSASESVQRAADSAAQSAQDVATASKKMGQMADVIKVVAIGVGVVAGLGLLYVVVSR